MNRVRRGQAREHERASLLPSELRGLRDERGRSDADIVCVGGGDGIHDHFIPDRDTLDVRSNRRHNSGAVHTEARQRFCEAGGILLVVIDLMESSAVELPIERVDARGANLHHDLIRCRNRDIDFLNRENFGTTECLRTHNLCHETLQRVQNPTSRRAEIDGADWPLIHSVLFFGITGSATLATLLCV